MSAGSCRQSSLRRPASPSRGLDVGHWGRKVCELEGSTPESRSRFGGELLAAFGWQRTEEGDALGALVLQDPDDLRELHRQGSGHDQISLRGKGACGQRVRLSVLIKANRSVEDG